MTEIRSLISQEEKQKLKALTELRDCYEVLALHTVSEEKERTIKERIRELSSDLNLNEDKFHVYFHGIDLGKKGEKLLNLWIKFKLNCRQWFINWLRQGIIE